MHVGGDFKGAPKSLGRSERNSEGKFGPMVDGSIQPGTSQRRRCADVSKRAQGERHLSDDDEPGVCGNRHLLGSYHSSERE